MKLIIFAISAIVAVVVMNLTVQVAEFSEAWFYASLQFGGCLVITGAAGLAMWGLLIDMAESAGWISTE